MSAETKLASHARATLCRQNSKLWQRAQGTAARSCPTCAQSLWSTNAIPDMKAAPRTDVVPQCVTFVPYPTDFFLRSFEPDEPKELAAVGRLLCRLSSGLPPSPWAACMNALGNQIRLIEISLPGSRFSLLPCRCSTCLDHPRIQCILTKSSPGCWPLKPSSWPDENLGAGDAVGCADSAALTSALHSALRVYEASHVLHDMHHWMDLAHSRQCACAPVRLPEKRAQTFLVGRDAPQAQRRRELWMRRHCWPCAGGWRESTGFGHRYPSPRSASTHAVTGRSTAVARWSDLQMSWDVGLPACNVMLIR